jgi:phosphatidylinositol-3-phosphatase
VFAGLFVASIAACGGSSSASSSSTGRAPTPVPPAPPSADPTPATDGGIATQPAPDGGTASAPPAPTPVPPPAPKFAGLANGALLAGPVALTATVAADTGSVQFKVDGAVVASVSVPPFETTWNSFSAGNGAHALEVQATDTAGQVTTSEPLQVTVSNHIDHVFVILMENHNWSEIKGSASAPYINNTLLTQGAHAENYQNVPGLHPSLPNYIWLESGSNQGVLDDGNPSSHLLKAPHLTGLLNSAGVTWKAYEEDISGTDCPLNPVNKYFPKHNPAVYFQDINGGLSTSSSVCIDHVRPYAELGRDLEVNVVPAYSFITPNICNDMHDNTGCASTDSVANGDAWLAREVPHILASRAYQEGGALFITWDESEGGNVPIGFIALSPLAKAGYTSNVAYTHSSTVRSLQEIFAVTPLLGGAASATNLADLFQSFP